MTQAIDYNKKLLELAGDFSNFVKKNKWIPRYDLETDALSITAPKLSKDVGIKYFDDEIAFYITKSNKVEGVFIEYFGSNYAQHHKGLKNIMKDLKPKKAKEQSLVRLEQVKFEKIAQNLEKDIKDIFASRMKVNLQNS